jgi:hypothetical protein
VWSLFCFNSTDGTWRWTRVHVPTLLQAVCRLPVHCIANTVCSSCETGFVITGIGICHQFRPFQFVVIVTLYPAWSHKVRHSSPLQAMRPFSNTAFYFNYLFLQKCLREKFLWLLASQTSSIIWYLEPNTVFHAMGLISSSIEKWRSSRQSYSPRFWSVLGWVYMPLGLSSWCFEGL